MKLLQSWLLTGLLSATCALYFSATQLTLAGKPHSPAPSSESQPLEKVRLFIQGQQGYHTFRIPSLVVTARGTLLALCEGRRQSARDFGNIDLVCRRSTDGGKTWSKLQTIWDDGPNTCGNPCPVVDAKTGCIWLLMTWNRGDDQESAIIAQRSKDTRRVFINRSADDGLSWSRPIQITEQVKPTNWTWYATGPGAGIQIQYGPKQGRLVIPCDHIGATTRSYGAHVIYSDDHGQSWKLGGSAPQHQVNECEVVELENGRLLLNMRNYDQSNPTRQIALSADWGETWTNQRHDPELLDPICQASIRRYSWSGNRGPGIVLFSNPASRQRERMTVRASFDDGQTWPVGRVVEPGRSAYSCLASWPDGTIGLLYESGVKSAYEGITLARFSVTWLRNKHSSN